MTLIEAARKDSRSVRTYCTRDTSCVGSDIGIGSWSVSTYHMYVYVCNTNTPYNSLTFVRPTMYHIRLGMSHYFIVVDVCVRVRLTFFFCKIVGKDGSIVLPWGNFLFHFVNRYLEYVS